MEKILDSIAKELSASICSVDDSSLEALSDKIINAKRVFFAGCGRSGLIMRTLAMRIMHIGLEAHFVGEVTQPSIRKGDVIIIGSSSGETNSMVHIANVSKENDAKLCLITSKDQSTLSELSDCVVVIPNRKIKSVQPDGNLFEQSMFCVCDGIAIKVKERMNITEDVMDYNHTNLE